MSEAKHKPDMCAVWEAIQGLGGIQKASLPDLERLAREHRVIIQIGHRGTFKIMANKEGQELPPVFEQDLFIPHARV
jgi:hypothetical protein